MAGNDEKEEMLVRTPRAVLTAALELCMMIAVFRPVKITGLRNGIITLRIQPARLDRKQRRIYNEVMNRRL